MARFWIGTSGWQYSDWKRRFYPQDLPQRDWLDYYCRHFPTVEINNSFYMQPRNTSWDRWRDMAPDGFCFAVKGHRYMTHLKRLKDCADSLERFFQAARRLGPHLGPVLFQLPPRFRRTDEHARRLESFIELLPTDVQVAFEFRDKSWFGDDTMGLLRDHRVALCSYDMPEIQGPFMPGASCAYMRFHGSGTRYRGNYTQKMLEDWAGRLNSVAADVDDFYVYFNNDAFGHAVRNAQTLAELLGARQPDKVGSFAQT